MKVLVTGGAGFIGSHLVEKLVEKGHSVTVYDDLSNSTLRNLVSVMKYINFYQVDISKYKILNGTINSDSFNTIVHLACFPRSKSFDNPQRDAEVNVVGAINMLELAKRSKARFIFSSNSGIYDATATFPITEDTPDNPKTPYDLHKQLTEKYMRMWADKYEIPIFINRFATIFGPRQTFSQDWKPVIRIFIEQLLNGETPTIQWHGNQSRDFVYVDDIVSALLKEVETDVVSPQPTILGTGREVTINQVYNIINKILGINIEPKRAPKIWGDIERMQYDCRKAETLLGWRAETGLEIGLRKMIDWARRERHGTF